MARPEKNSCEYFSHDRDMRNHKKIKAIRSKFKTTGYAIWVMFLEHLTGSEGNVFKYSDLEIELLAGDFDVSVTEIRDVLDYCILIELLNNNNGLINSNSLDERLAPVYAKRSRSKENSKKQTRSNGKFTAESVDNTGVSVTETPQSKVNKSKVNNKKKASPIQDKTLILDYVVTKESTYEEKAVKQFHTLFCTIATPPGQELKDKTLMKAKMDSWKKDMGLLLKTDERTHDDLKEVYDHLNSSKDRFWAETVSSISGIRKNFDKIMAKIRLEKHKTEAIQTKEQPKLSKNESKGPEAYF